jgi:hypothetical protein
LAFADVDEDILDLQDIVDVGLDLGSPLEDFVLVAGNFITLLA